MPELHDYQKRAVKHLHEHAHAGLFLDMGLGKTAIVLTALTPDRLPALVIAPKRVAEHVWQAERDKWRPDLSIAIAAGSPGNRQAALRSGAGIVVIGRDNIKDVPAGQFDTIILDELSGFKSRSTNRWRLARKLTGPATTVWGLTGTPTPNGLMDLWAPMFLLDRGERLGTGIGKYRDRYFNPGRRLPQTHIVTEWLLKPGAEKAIHRRVEDICLSMSSIDHLDLPPVTYNEVTVPLPPKVKSLYKEMKETLVADLDMLGGPITAANAAVLSNKLSQISAGFLYDDDGYTSTTLLHSEKVNAVQEIVDGTGSPVLVFYRYKVEADRLLELDGAHHIDEPDSIDRWNRGEIPILIAHPASAGHGLNLQGGGHTAIWASLSWSLEEYQQGIARLARQGQKNPVVIHHLLSPGTIDRAILRRLQKKDSVQEALLEHLRE